MIGSTISHYQILEKLGEGGMGVVYRAEDTRLRRIVALKFLAREALGEEEVKARLIREAQAAASLDHPNICHVYGIHEEQGKTFIAMAYIDGPSLADKIKDRPLPLDEALDIAVEIAAGLQDAHDKGVVHRDIKPHNVMLTAKGQVKIMDFGLAVVAGRSRLTKSGTTLGTPLYMAPEQLEGRDVDRRADIWALGCVLYEMLTQRTPFDAEYEQAIGYGILNEDPEPVTAQRSGLPVELDSIVNKTLAKSREQRYQHVDEFAVDLRQLRAKSVSGSEPRSRTKVQTQKPSWGRLAAGAALLVMASAALTLWLTPQPLSNEQRVLRRLTTGAGLSAWPALSPRGDLFAYASDRAGRGDLDVWVRQVSGGDPVRLTDDPADNYEPSFSPDGSQVAFRSERGQGGIYLVSALGGDVRLIAEGGRRPRFSPDGEWVAFWRGNLNEDATKSFVVPAGGGPERRIHPEFYGVRDPTWSPDGKQILFSGFPQAEIGIASKREWWIAPSEGGPATPVETLELFRSFGFAFPFLGAASATSPADWLEDGIAFQARLGDSTNVWKIGVSSGNGKAQGSPRRLTSGAGTEVHPRVTADGRIIFTNLSLNEDVWGLPLDLNKGESVGELRRITQDLGSDRAPDLSADGTRVVFVSDRRGSDEVWIKELDTGRERQLTFNSPEVLRPNISPSGEQVAYMLEEGSLRPIYIVPATGGVGKKVCDDCGNVTDWHPNEEWLLFEKSTVTQEGADTGVQLLNISSGKQVPIVSERGRRFHDTRFSSDGRGVVTGATSPSQILLASFRGEQEIPIGEWVEVAEKFQQKQSPVWSPDGNMIYFLSDRDGFRCVYGQRLEPQTKQPRGDPFAVYHFHQTSRSLMQTNGGSIVPSLGGGLFVFGMNETKGNIWMSEAISDGPQ